MIDDRKVCQHSQAPLCMHVESTLYLWRALLSNKALSRELGHNFAVNGESLQHVDGQLCACGEQRGQRQCGFDQKLCPVRLYFITKVGNLPQRFHLGPQQSWSWLSSLSPLVGAFVHVLPGRGLYHGCSQS